MLPDRAGALEDTRPPATLVVIMVLVFRHHLQPEATATLREAQTGTPGTTAGHLEEEEEEEHEAGLATEGAPLQGDHHGKTSLIPCKTEQGTIHKPP